MKLMYMNTKEAKEKFVSSVGILVIGSIEHHGLQCPLGTDYIIPDHIAERISEREDVIILPGIPYGVTPSIADFHGTLDIGHDNLLNILRSITDSLLKQGMKKIIFINGHGGNIGVLDRIGLEIYKKGGIAATIDWWLIAAQINPKFQGGHGDIQETSAVMAICPKSVKLNLCEPQIINQLSDEIVNKYISTLSFKNGLVKIHRTFKDVVPNGWIGPFDPKNSTEELGREMMNEMVEYVNDFIDAFKKIKI